MPRIVLFLAFAESTVGAQSLRECDAARALVHTQMERAMMRRVEIRSDKILKLKGLPRNSAWIKLYFPGLQCHLTLGTHIEQLLCEQLEGMDPDPGVEDK